MPWGDWLRILIRPTAATRSLVRTDSHLRDLNHWYRRWAAERNINHLILYEKKETSVFGMIVTPDNADPGLSSDPIPIDAIISQSRSRKIVEAKSTCSFEILLSAR